MQTSSTLLLTIEAIWRWAIKGLAGLVFEARIIELNVCVRLTRSTFYLPYMEIVNI